MKRGVRGTVETGAWRAPDLSGRVALVAGATRGAGRAIAVTLGECGATVYCTGRSSRDAARSAKRPETIEETAELVTIAGGRGVAVRTDHTRPPEVQALVERIAGEAGHIDVLVNDVWGGDELTEWGRPFWEHSLEKGLTMVERAVHTHLITSHFAAPLVMKSPRGVIVEVTDGDAEINREYRGNLYYDLVKTTLIRVAFAMAAELKPKKVAVVAVSPGFLRSEAMLDHFGVTEETWREGVKKDPYFAESETPYYVARGVAHLAADRDVLRRTGQSFVSWNLAKEYGFSDRDGRRPDFGAVLAKLAAEKPATT